MSPSVGFSSLPATSSSASLGDSVGAAPLPLIGGREAEFAIDQPQIIAANSSGNEHSLPGTVAQVKLDLDEGVCAMTLAVDGTLPERLTPEAIEITRQTLEWDTL